MGGGFGRDGGRRRARGSGSESCWFVLFWCSFGRDAWDRLVVRENDERHTGSWI